MHVLNCITPKEQLMFCTSCGEQFFSIIGCNFDLMDLIAAIVVIMFVIEIEYELNNVNSIAIRIEIDNRIGYNWDLMDRITVRSHVCDVFNGIVLVIVFCMLIKMSSLSLLHILSFILGHSILYLHKLSKIECVYGNNSDVTINIYNFCKVSVTAIVGGMFSTVIYLACEWFPNVSMKNIDIYDNDRLSCSSALFGICGNNRNVLGKSYYIIDTVTITRSTDLGILAIVQESTVNNTDGRIESNLIDLYNFAISDNQPTIIYHSYTQKPMSHIQIIDSEWTSNVQCGSSQVSSSNNLIVIEQDGSCCRQVPISTIGDASLISHFTLINNQFIDNIFEAAIIDTYCAAVDISSCDFNNNENNGNDASPDGCNHGGCMGLHDSSMICAKCTFYNMNTGDIKLKTITS